MASDYKVPYTKILDIQPHGNADRLEIATVYGFQVIVSKGKYQVGDQIIYVPIDSVLPNNLESIIFPPDSKIKLNRGRVRQIRIRGLASQGMLVDKADVRTLVNPDYFKEEQDLQSVLGITKYEPPQAGPAHTQPGTKNRNKRNPHPDFHKYNGLENIKWFPNLFKDGQEVVIQEKLHGTNARAAILPFQANTLLKKVLKFLKLSKPYENCYGSNNVDISASSSYKGFYGEDVYGKVFKNMDVFNKLKPNESVFGEIIGAGIQKGYDYGTQEHKFVLFDVKRLQDDGTQVWLSPAEVEAFAKERGFEYVPVIYRGPYNKDMSYALTKGPSVYDPKTKVREGIVIKAATDYTVGGNKQALKWVSEDYLADEKNTDFH